LVTVGLSHTSRPAKPPPPFHPSIYLSIQQDVAYTLLLLQLSWVDHHKTTSGAPLAAVRLDVVKTRISALRSLHAEKKTEKASRKGVSHRALSYLWPYRSTDAVAKASDLSTTVSALASIFETQVR